MGVVTISVITAGFVLLALTSVLAPEKAPGVSGEAAWQRLLEGNQRFVGGAATQAHRDAGRRTGVAKGQHPLAIVVGCADSRVPPELLFDQGLGDLFVVRLAGACGR